MTPITITRRQLKAMINRDEWHEIGRIFNFAPVFMLSEGGKRYMIDWRCVPQSVSEVLWRKSEPEELVNHESKFTGQGGPTRIKSPIEMRQLEHFGDAIVNLAARVVAKEMSHPTVYFLCAAHLASNKNLSSAGFTTGAQAEVEIGKDFIANGLDSAFKFAVEIIKRTSHYREHHKI